MNNYDHFANGGDFFTLEQSSRKGSKKWLNSMDLLNFDCYANKPLFLSIQIF
jgi:hypothetical protein